MCVTAERFLKDYRPEQAGLELPPRQLGDEPSTALSHERGVGV